MRTALQQLSRHGGHINPNPGVEATIAQHYVFDSPVDKLVFDVSHQSHCHKLLIGRSRDKLKCLYWDGDGFFTSD